MSKEYLKDAFSKLTCNHAWSLQLLQIKYSTKNGTSYISREIEIDPAEKLISFIDEISKYYCSEKGIDDYSSVDDYTGDIVDHCIYKLGENLVSDELKALQQTIADPDRETPMNNFRKFDAALYKGTVTIENVSNSVLLISMQNPITVLNNKFLWMERSKFKPINGAVLNLRKTIDIAVIGSTVYLFTLAGEKLFNMERTYKAICKYTVDEIAKCDFISDSEMFISAANAGRNPRRFIAYNASHLEAIKNVEKRKEMGDKFDIALLDDDKVDTADSKNVERFVKFLCNKAMVDPCDSSPMEVSASKPWQ